MSNRTLTVFLVMLAAGAVVGSMPAGERREKQLRKGVPLIQEIDLGTVHLDPAGRAPGPKGQEIRFGRGYEYPSSLDFAEISLADLGKHVFGEDEEAKITRQMDPEQQQLLLVRWYSWAAGTDKLTYQTRRGRIEFTLHLGLSRSLGHGRPDPQARLFAVRSGARWVGWSEPHPQQPPLPGKSHPSLDPDPGS